MDLTPEMVNALAALLWPVMAIAAIAYLAPILRERFRSGDLSIKIGDFELSAQEANDQLRGQIEDLQAKVAALQGAGPMMVKQSPVEPVPESPAAGLEIMWVDDKPANNATLIAALEQAGHAVVLARSTDEAVNRLKMANPDMILSDIGRPEGRRAGLDFLRALRDEGKDVPYGLFTSTMGANRHRAEATRMGATFVTSSATDLMAEIGRLAPRST